MSCTNPSDEKRLADAMALLAILALGERQIREGKVKPLSEVASRLKQRFQALREARRAGDRTAQGEGSASSSDRKPG